MKVYVILLLWKESALPDKVTKVIPFRKLLLFHELAAKVTRFSQEKAMVSRFFYTQSVGYGGEHNFPLPPSTFSQGILLRIKLISSFSSFGISPLNFTIF